MTRFLSESLQATEPFFRTTLRRLEAANGNPNTDIRFSTEIMRATQAKLHELGLDPRDTTAEELYHALQERVKADDARLVKTLRTRAATHVSADGDVVAGMVHTLKMLPDNHQCFALKAGSLRRLLKQQPPRQAVKQLGYRSLDSFLKHESPVSMLAAAWLSENSQWQKRFHEQYKRLTPGDFESRAIIITRSDFKRWNGLAEHAVAQTKHNVLSLKELGALVILPFSTDVPAGAVTVSLTLALHELNEIRAAGTFLKLSQVRPDFGTLVQSVAGGEPQLSNNLLDQPISWSLIQKYYARLTDRLRDAVFEPHMQLDDMTWQPVEAALAQIEPSLAFWQHSGHLGVIDRQKPVSLNVMDAALNYCNKLPFEQRIAHYFQRSLWHELLLRYLQHETVEQTIAAQLQPELAAETVTA